MQQGSVILTRRKYGPDVWQFRWSEKDRSGCRIYRKRVGRDGSAIPGCSGSANWTTALCHINGDARGRKITLEQICEHFEQRE